MKWWRLCCQPQGSRPRAHSTAQPYLSQMLGDKHHPSASRHPSDPSSPLHSPYILLPCCFLASRAAITSHSCQSCWINRCCSPVYLPPSLHSRAILLYLSPCGIPLSIYSPLPSPPSVFAPPSSLGPLPLSALLRGRSPVCVAWQPARSCCCPPPFSYLILPSSSSFLPLIPCSALSAPLFLFPATFSSYVPLSPSLSPPASNHSPLHLFHSLPPFILRALSFSPSLPPSFPPSSHPPGWAQEQ